MSYIIKKREIQLTYSSCFTGEMQKGHIWNRIAVIDVAISFKHLLKKKGEEREKKVPETEGIKTLPSRWKNRTCVTVRTCWMQNLMERWVWGFHCLMTAKICEMVVVGWTSLWRHFKQLKSKNAASVCWHWLQSGASAGGWVRGYDLTTPGYKQ